ncbi:8596_t:CDS:2, partial [Acaulospora morrowiae]
NGNPEEEEMESLCKLLTTVGQQLDHFKAKSHMNQYFERMESMSKNNALNSRIRFMLMDVIELRNNDWVPRRDNNAPKTIAEIHEDAAKQKEEAEFMRRTASSGGRGLPKMADQMSRTGSGRRDKGSGPHGSGGQQTDGWSTVAPSASRKTGDLSKFGALRNKVSGSVNLTPGGGAFSSKWKTESKDRDDKTLGMARANSTSNTYSVLTHTDTETRKSSDGSFDSQKSTSMERKKLQLMPPSKTISDENNAPKSIMTKSSSASPMSEETARKKIDNMIEEYFNVLDIGEVIYCINDLPKEYHSMAITEFANKALEKKQEDVYKVTDLFKTFVTKGVITKPIFMKGFSSTVEFLAEIGADAPKSYAFTGQLFYSSSIELKEVAELMKPLLEVDDDKGIEKVVSGYLDAWKEASDEQAIMQKVKEIGFDFKSIFSKKSISDLNKFFDDH